MVSGSEDHLSPLAAEAIFNSSPDAILIIDQKGQIRRTNQAADILLGYPARQLEQKTVEDLLPARLREVHREHREEYQADPRPRIMGLGLGLAAIRADGAEVPVDVALAPMVAPNGVFTIATIRRRAKTPGHAIPQVFRIISGRNPFQAWLMVFMFLVSLPLLFNAPPPNSVQAVVPHWAVLIWAFCLSTSSAVNLIGIYWRKKVEIAVTLEMTSCIVLAISNLLYPASIITFTMDNGTTANIWYVVTLLVGFSICAMGRFYQLLQDRREVSAVKKIIRAAGV